MCIQLNLFLVSIVGIPHQWIKIKFLCRLATAELHNSKLESGQDLVMLIDVKKIICMFGLINDVYLYII